MQNTLLQPRFMLTLPANDVPETIMARRWLLLGVLALALAGFFALLLVTARTPEVQQLIPVADLFGIALATHVNLSVLIWFLAFSTMLWCLQGLPDFLFASKAAFWCVAAGTLSIAIAPFTEGAEPFKNNYIPVVMAPLFFLGLSLVLAGIVVQAVVCILHYIRSPYSLLRFGIASSAFITLCAAIGFFWSHWQIPEGLDKLTHYEFLFWGGGHILQFTYTQAALVAWFWLAAASGVRLGFSARLQFFIYVFGVYAAIVAFFIYLIAPAGTPEHSAYFTDHMRYLGGVAPAMAAVFILVCRRLTPHGMVAKKSPEWLALKLSVLLYALGGVLGYMIAGSNVTIPAHYHGAITGITAAFMGLSYHLLPRLGCGEIPARAARWQLWFYASGHLLHVLGLAISGGYGVARKSTATLEGMSMAKAMMGMMGLGGLLAVIGGLMFVVLALRSFCKRGAPGGR